MPIVAAGFPALGLQGRMWPRQGCAGSWWAVGAAAAPRVTLTQGCELLLFWGLCFPTGSVCWCRGCSVPQHWRAQGLSGVAGMEVW